MGGCCVMGCKNRSGGGFSLRRFPKNPDVRKAWLENVRCKNRTPNPHSLVCEVHFESSMWEKVRVDGKRKLRANAIPTIFPYKKEESKLARVNIVMEDCNLVIPMASVTKSSEDTIIEFRPDSHFLKGEKKQDVSLSDKADMYKQAVMTYKYHIKQLEDRLQTQCDLAILKGVFNSDQIDMVRNGYVTKWSEATIKDALKFKFSCGSRGYRELLAQRIPLPSLEILRKHLESVKFDSGILNEIFDYLKLKMLGFTRDSHKDCTVHLDEVSILPANIYDPTQSKCLGTVSRALVVTLEGIGTQWTQIVAYYFTRKSVSSSEYSKILERTICKTEELGLKAVSVTCNITEFNQCLLHEQHSDIKNYIPHPLDTSRKLYILTDVSALFKKIKSMFVAKKIIRIPDAIKELHCLPNNCADFTHVEDLIKTQEVLNFRLVPTIIQQDLIQTYWKSHTSLIEYDITGGLTALANELERPECKTTAWLIDITEKWYTLMTSQHPILALNKEVPKVYQETIEFLTHFMKLFKQIHIANDNVWSQCQIEVLLSTQSVLDMQNLLLNEKRHEFVLTSRFTKSCVEELLRNIDAKGTPSVVEFTSNLRLICADQYFEDVPVSNYKEADMHSETVKIENV